MLQIGQQFIKLQVQQFIKTSNSQKGWQNQIIIVGKNCSLQYLFLWACEKVSTWIKQATTVQTNNNKPVILVGRKLQKYFFECFLVKRAGQYFEIMWDYPQSLVCLSHFKSCLDITGRYLTVKDIIIKQLKTQLFIPSIKTQSIINLLINTISILNILDPVGTLIKNHIIEKFRSYLEKRSDSAVSMVKLITEKQSILYKDLGKKYKEMTFHSSGNFADEDLNDQDVESARKWQPRYIYNIEGVFNSDNEDSDNQEVDNDDDNDNDNRNKKYQDEISLTELSEIIAKTQLYRGGGSHFGVEKKQLDVISLLISIIGKQKFLAEYQKTLSQRIIFQDRQGYNQEKINIQFLKQRFGQNALLKADIMMRDFVESRRFLKAAVHHHHHHQQEQPSIQKSLIKKCEPVIGSRHFWPIEREQEAAGYFVPVGEMANIFEAVQMKYSEKKKLRKLALVPQEGYVEIEVDFQNGRKQNMTVKPLQAAIIDLFNQCKINEIKSGWQVKDQAQEKYVRHCRQKMSRFKKIQYFGCRIV